MCSGRGLKTRRVKASTYLCSFPYHGCAVYLRCRSGNEGGHACNALSGRIGAGSAYGYVPVDSVGCLRGFVPADGLPKTIGYGEPPGFVLAALTFRWVILGSLKAAKGNT